MATIANEYDPNDPNNPNNAPDTSGGGGAGSAAAGGTSAPSATPYQPPNVSQYLAANQGAGQQLTQGITGNVQSQANQLDQNVTNTQNQLNKQSQPLETKLGAAQGIANTAFKDPQALLDSYNNAKAQQPGTTQQTAPSNPQDLSTYNEFQKLNAGGYGQDIQNYGNYGQQQQAQLQGQLGNLTQQTGSAGNEMGRAELLRNAVGQGNYNQGQQTLDTLFLQGQPGQRNAQGLSNLQQLQQNLGNIGQQAGQQVTGLGSATQNKLNALQGMSAADKAGIKNLFTTGQWGAGSPAAAGGPLGLNQIGTNVANEYATAQTDVPKLQALLGTEAKTGAFSPEEMGQFGIPQDQHTWGINDVTPYLTNNALTGNAQTATPEEFARYQALQQLSGGSLQPNIFGSQTTAGNYTPVSFDNPRFQTDVAAKQKTVQGDLTTQAQNLYNDLLRESSTQGTGVTWDDANQAMFQRNQNLLGGMLKNNNVDAAQVAKAAQEYSNIHGARAQGGRDFTNWYNSTYQPEANAILGQPAIPNLPTNPQTGAIDWSQIKQPLGK